MTTGVMHLTNRFQPSSSGALSLVVMSGLTVPRRCSRNGTTLCGVMTAYGNPSSLLWPSAVVGHANLET